ncbi:MAG: PadR family transcriptional regulator [Alphaproteobacteria bacterium]|nr:PadR family transcriptional regulator [Alphaproteobacteria bacterium]MBU2083985.1 PadR family transcriptional regulator [Alphaproteobacteria bacterium]MBU2142649.1 PadR family transcriptional regulator [Alphaproteobacteria bacterium]MBU2196262.1 PadR family transcriptional regulator [Alphaproteobacteria bacterium]
MALEHAILVCLSEQDLSGYDLAKQFDTSIGFFWHASHPQIYRELRKLKDQGLLVSTDHSQVGKPNKTVYSLTDTGREALFAWSQRAVEPPAVKDELLVRLYALDDIDRPALMAQLHDRLEKHQERLRQYRRIKETQYASPDLSSRQQGKLIALEMGIRYEENWVSWCEEALETLTNRA